MVLIPWAAIISKSKYWTRINRPSARKIRRKMYAQADYIHVQLDFVLVSRLNFKPKAIKQLLSHA